MLSRPEALIWGRLAAAGLVFLLSACSTGPAPPAQGTPAWYWQAALDTYAAGDYTKAEEHLDQVADPGSEFAAQAIPFQMVLTAGMATGNMKLADAFEAGARANPAGSVAFRRNMNEYRSIADRYSVQFAEAFLAFNKAAAEGPVPLAFGYPKGSALPVAEVTKANQGIALSEGEVATAARRSVEREVLMTACLAVGAEDDTAKTQQAFSGENASVPKNDFLLGMARKMNEVANYYSAYKMDRPDRRKQLNEIALTALNAVPENDDTKELKAKIEKEIAEADKRL